MQKINKRTLIIIIAIVLILIGFLVSMLLFNNKDKSKGKYDYYYTYVYDDNLITQSVTVYDKNDSVQSNYFVFYKDEIVTLTKGEKAVLTINTLDLKEKPELVIIFENDEKKYSLGPKE